jgi:hypothetical protein
LAAAWKDDCAREKKAMAERLADEQDNTEGKKQQGKVA